MENTQTQPQSAGRRPGQGGGQRGRGPGGPGGRSGGPGREFKKNPRKPGRRESRVKPEFDHKIVSIRRVARVVAGGRRFNFSVALVAGDRKGRVGVGLGKGGDTPLSIEKAMRDAKKNMVKVHLTKEMSIPHDIEIKYASARVLLKPAPGKGIIAGSSVRSVLELAGVKEVSAKILSPSKNQLNNARAAVKALSRLAKPRVVEAKEAKEA